MDREVIVKLDLFIRKAFDIFFLVSPVATSMGVMLALAANGFSEVFSPLTQEAYSIDISQVSFLGWLGLCVFSCNLIALPFRKKLKKEVLDAIATIEKARVSDLQKRKMYLELFKIYISSINLNQKMQEQLNELSQK